MKALKILLVEDNEGDIMLTTEALSESKISNHVSVAKDGWQALQYMESKEDGDLPDLVLLDVNLPKMNGHEVLKNIKSNDKLKHIPVIMLTTSSSERDILSSYQNHVNCYITKPVDADDFLKVILSVEHFWISIVKLPQN